MKISLIAVSLVSALGIQFLSAAALPILLGSIADRITLSPSQIGLLGTSELASIAIAAFAVSPVVGRRSRVALAAAGCASAAVGNFMTAHAYTLTLLSISRAVAGAGMGVSAAAAQAAAAASPQPERLFGIYFAVSTALGALLLLGLPQLIAIHGYAAGYSLLGAVSLIATPLVAWLPPPPALVNSTIEQTRTSEAPRRARGILALTALALVSASDYGTWTFIERIGAGAGLGPEAIGETLAIGTLVASGASALAAWVGTRFGRLRPLVASFCCMVVAVIGFSSAASPAIYIAMLMVWCASVFIAYSYLMGALAVADATGRLSATAAGARSIGAAIGPTAAGVVVAGLGYRSAGLMVGCWCALALVLSLSFILHLSRTERARQLNPT